MYLCTPFERIGNTYWTGEVVEWSITAVLKTVDVKASGGSNPSLSAPEKLKFIELKLFFPRPKVRFHWRG